MRLPVRLPEAERVRMAGYLHDLGRVAVSSAVWDKPGPLTRNERDQVELHPYYTERVLARYPPGRPGSARRPAPRTERRQRLPPGAAGGTTPLRPGCWPQPTATAAWSSRVLIERPCRPTRPRGCSAMMPAPAAGRRGGGRGAAGGRRPDHVAEPRPAGLTDRQLEVLGCSRPACPTGRSPPDWWSRPARRSGTSRTSTTRSASAPGPAPPSTRWSTGSSRPLGSSTHVGDACEQPHSGHDHNDPDHAADPATADPSVRDAHRRRAGLLHRGRRRDLRASALRDRTDGRDKAGAGWPSAPSPSRRCSCGP